MTLEETINLIKDGDEKSIEYGLSTDNAFLIINSIMSVINHGIRTKEIINMIEEKKCYDETVAGIEMRNVYDSALDILGIEKYKGDNPCVLSFIRSGKYY